MRRPRLTTLLDDATSQCIILQAPAGYGKTSLACEWLEGREDVAWFTARQDSADVAAFSVGIAEAMTHIVPDAPNRVRERVLVAEPREDAARPLAEVLAADLADWPEGAILVVDDYHLAMASSATELFVDWLLMRCPQLRMLVTTRRRPGWATARRTLTGDIVIVGRDALAMNSDESETLLSGVTRPELEVIQQHADGWPALYGLASLAGVGASALASAADDAYQYLAEEVLRGQDESLQTVMLAASIPPTVSPDIVEAMLPGLDCTEPLNHLLRDGLLRRGEGGTLTFHPLLRTVLRQTAVSRSSDAFRTSLRASCAHFVSQASWDDAIEVATELGTGELTTTVLAAADDLLAAGRLESLSGWILRIVTHATDPLLLALQAEVAAREGRTHRAYALAMAALNCDARSGRETVRSLLPAARAALHTGRDDEAYALAHRADALHPEGRDLVETLILLALAGCESPGLLSAASTAVRRLQEVAHISPEAELRALSAQLAYHDQIGDLTGVRAIVDGGWHAWRSARDPYARTSFVYLAASVMAAAGDFETSLALAEQGLLEARSMGLALASVRLQIPAVVSMLGLTDIEAAKARLEKCAATAGDDPWAAGAISTARARIALSCNDPQYVLSLSARPLPTAVSASTRGEFTALRGIALLQLEQHDEAGDTFRDANSLTVAADARTLTACGRAGLICSRNAAGTPAEVEALLAGVIDTNGFGNLVACLRWLPLLRPALLNTPLASRVPPPITELVEARKRDDRLGRVPGSEALTKRELEVLQLIAEGLTNSEIGARLFIEQSTAKEHVHRVLQKLGVRSRVEAALFVARGGSDGFPPRRPADQKSLGG